MSIFSLIIIVIIIVNTLRSKSVKDIFISLFIINILIEMFINVGYFYRTESIIISYVDFLQGVIFIFGIIILFKNKSIISKEKVTYIFIVLFVLAFSISLLVLHPYAGLVRLYSGLDRITADAYWYPKLNTQTFKTSIRYVVFLINAILFISLINKVMWYKVSNYIYRMGIFIIIYAWLEFIVKNLFQINLFKPILDFVFGSRYGSDMMIYRSGFFVVNGLNNEPSQFAMTLYYFVIFIILSKISSRKKVFYIFNGLLLMFLSGSLRFIGLVPFIFVFIIITNFSFLKAFISLVIVSILGGFIYFDIIEIGYYISRFSNLIVYFFNNEFVGSTGEAYRINTVVEGFKVFFNNPIFGIGLGVTFSYGFLPSLLASLGLIGLIVWISYIKIVVCRRVYLSEILFLFLLHITFIYTSAIDILYSIVILSILLQLKVRKNNKGEVFYEK